MQVKSESSLSTESLGDHLGRVAEPGDVIVLHGQLGAGKTTFVRGVAVGLGIDPGDVSSPTFVIQHIHNGRLPLYHFDLYRLSSADELFDFGAEDFFWGQGLSVIEWPEIALSGLPPNVLEVRFELDLKDPETRQILLVPNGSWVRRLSLL
jgi:tRNA threonylcarbamoyladenosine biosynthesis protein TsaE